MPALAQRGTTSPLSCGGNAGRRANRWQNAAATNMNCMLCMLRFLGTHQADRILQSTYQEACQAAAPGAKYSALLLSSHTDT